LTGDSFAYTEEKSKFLCGHDERHWFVAAIPSSERRTSRSKWRSAGATSITSASDSVPRPAKPSSNPRARR
jgi:hypothetical protein